MEEVLDIKVAFQDEDSQELITALQETGVEDISEIKQRGITGIEVVVVGILVANALTNLIMKLLRLWKCGIVVDARGKQVLTKKNCDLPRGTVLIINRNNTETKLSEPSEFQITDLISGLFQKGS